MTRDNLSLTKDSLGLSHIYALALSINFTVVCVCVCVCVCETFFVCNCSNDLRLDENFMQSIRFSSHVVLKTMEPPVEQFSHDDSVTAHTIDCTGLDPILEICITDDTSNEEEPQPLVATNETRLPSPDKDFMNQVVQESNEGNKLLDSNTQIQTEE